MYNSTRRGRLGVATLSSAGPRTTLGPDISDISVAERVSNLGLTTATITPQVEERLRWLLDEILLQGQFGENAFQIVAYACALEKENNVMLFELILDLIFDRVKADRDAKFHCGRLFGIMAREMLPTIHDGFTVDSNGSPIAGTDLFRHYLVDRFRREIGSSSEHKEIAIVTASASPDDVQASATLQKALECWLDLVDLINDSRKRFVIGELLIHEIIEKQLSAPQPTDQEIRSLVALTRPDGADALSYTMKDRLRQHYSRIQDLVRDDKLTRNSRENLQKYVLDKLSNAVAANRSNASGHNMEESMSYAYTNHTIPPVTNQPVASDSNAQQLKVLDENPTSKTGVAAPEQTSIPVFDPSVLENNEFNVTATTPLSLVIAFFTQVAQPPVADYTTELEQGTCEPNPVVGGMSDVWRVRLRKGTHVAVKCLRAPMSGGDKVVKRTVKELAAWSQQQHVNILQLLGLALFKDRLAMVSEWMDQGSIISVVNSRPEVDRYDLCIQVASIVAWLHNKELVHGDLKGANILVSSDGIPKLTDFGLAVMREGVFKFSQTDEGTGTMRWMAPELFNNDAKRTYKTDVYALGMTILEILTGREPFEEITSGHWIPKAVSVHKMTPTRPECLAEGTRRNEVFWQAMRRAWVYEPSKRATAEEIEKLIRSAEGDNGSLMKSVKGRGMRSGCTMA